MEFNTKAYEGAQDYYSNKTVRYDVVINGPLISNPEQETKLVLGGDLRAGCVRVRDIWLAPTLINHECDYDARAATDRRTYKVTACPGTTPVGHVDVSAAELMAIRRELLEGKWLKAVYG